MVIAIDGPAGSGKSTISELLARRLGFTYVNSGNLYRAITFGCLKADISNDEKNAVFYARNADIDYVNGAVLLNGEDITAVLHDDKIDKHVPFISSIVEIRHIINDRIKKIAGIRDIVVEGRDMTTVVFPGAEHRFYLDAAVSARAKRRFEQNLSDMNFDEIKKSIEERDEKDRGKTEGSLKLGDGVVYVDTSLLTIEQTYEKLKDNILCKG
jgi:cytidylate kinase